MWINRIQMLTRFITCALILLAASIQQSGKVIGYELIQSDTESIPPTLSGTEEEFVIDTRAIASDIRGYGGSTPLRITVTRGKVSKIEALRNAETPEFFTQINDKLLAGYIGMTPKKVLQSETDAISGATLSSRAVIRTMNRGMEYAINQSASTARYIDWATFYSPKFIILLCVVLMGALIPLFFKSRRYRLVQLLLNVLVLGFWSGTFISYSMIINYLSNGIDSYSIIPVLLLITAFVYPFFGKKNHYCLWLCPLGSLQELAGNSVRYKWRLSPRMLKYLNMFHDGLWALLMLLMWSGICFRWMDYEAFTAFIFTKASWITITIALMFVALSFVVNRPYCRFICPTGSLFRITQNS